MIEDRENSIIDKVRNFNPVINSKNNPELARRIKELSAMYMEKNKETPLVPQKYFCL